MYFVSSANVSGADTKTFVDTGIDIREVNIEKYHTKRLGSKVI